MRRPKSLRRFRAGGTPTHPALLEERGDGERGDVGRGWAFVSWWIFHYAQHKHREGFDFVDVQLEDPSRSLCWAQRSAQDDAEERPSLMWNQCTLWNAMIIVMQDVPCETQCTLWNAMYFAKRNDHCNAGRTLWNAMYLMNITNIAKHNVPCEKPRAFVPSYPNY